MRYEPIFGDQSLFDGAPEDVVIAIKDILSTKKVYYFSKNGWIKNNNGRRLDCDVHQIAMRRIIPEPKRWTVADQKAGRLPEVGAKYNVDGCEVKHLGVGAAGYEDIFHFEYPSGACGCSNKIFIKPIEPPEEKAQRLRDDWCAKAVGVCGLGVLGMTTLTRIYDALLSGDLPVPGKEQL